MKNVIALFFLITLTLTQIFSQNSLNDLNVVFKHDFEKNTLGKYLVDEYKKDWNNPEWNNRQSTTKIVTDATNAENPSKALQIFYPANSLGPNEGGAHWFAAIPNSDELYISYDIYFMPGFQFQKGGKLPSVRGGSVTNGKKPNGYDGFSGGLMFKDNGDLAFYIYYPDSHLSGGNSTFYWGHKYASKQPFLPSLITFDYMCGTRSKMKPGTWHNITYRMVLNTVSNGKGNFDGILEAYFDGKLVSQISHILFRHTLDLHIDVFRIYTFFGGATDDWRNPINEWMKVDNVLVYTFKDGINVPRGNKLSATNRTINYWRNFKNTTPEPEPETPTSSNTIKINFVKDSEITASADWNNLISRSMGATHKLKDVNGQTTGVSLQVNSNAVYSSVNGTYPGLYPDQVMKTAWRADSYKEKNIKIKNLDKNKKYKFEIFGTNKTEIESGDTTKKYLNSYSIDGIKKSLFVYQNTDNTVSWIIQPDSVVDIIWSGGTAIYGFLNSLVISEADNDAIVENINQETEPETPIPSNIIKVNFVRNADISASSDWNNLITRSKGTTHNLSNEEGESTNIQLYVNSTEIYSSLNGSYPGIYDDDVLKTAWRADSRIVKTIQIKNLDTSKKYKFQIFGSNNSEIESVDKTKQYLNSYTVAGIEKSLCVYQNTDKTLSWVIKPQNSTIDITWAGGTAGYGFLNSLIISEAGANDVEDVYTASLSEEPAIEDTVNIASNDVIENSTPQIDAQTIEVNEIVFEAPILGVIEASDPDKDQSLTYSIVSGNESNLFDINPSTGVLTTSNSNIFTYSQLNYDLIVKVIDNGSPAKQNQAIVTIKLTPDPKVVYIDPTRTEDLYQNGSSSHPYDSWSDISWKSGYKYFQRRGTTSNEDKISVTANGITIGAYGEGSQPVINSNSNDYAIQALDKESLTITGIHIKANDAISAVYILGNSNGTYNIENCIIEGPEYGVRVIEGNTLNLKYNTFKNCVRAIYSFAGENNVHYNIFRNNDNALEIASLTSATTVYNNVFYENGSGVSSSYGDLSLFNNIFYIANEGDIALNLKLDKYLSDHNLFYPERDGFIAIADKSYNTLMALRKDHNIDLNSLNEDPQFVDVYNDNFSLGEYSPAINTGIFIGLDKDFAGTSVPYAGIPDIGVIEATFSRLASASKSINNNTSDMNIYPNPSKGLVNVQFNNANETAQKPSIIKVIDQSGRIIYTKNINSSVSNKTESIDLSSHDNGVYYLLIEMAGKVVTEKLSLIR